MAFSIVTNVASLLAQDNLRITSDLQQKTIQRLTSGLRINSSADDAAGLAIANSFRSDVAVLQQGIRNAGDGLSTLQTIDGGINNISLLLDRARTLATQSASGTFTGDRNVLNNEFGSVLDEIDRQAKAIGLDQSGLFAAALSVFIGGGRGHSGDAASVAITTGSISIDLTNSTVDARSLGLKGLEALGGTTGAGGTDIGTGSASTSVQAIVGNATNTGSERVSGFSDFYFAGPGFSDTSKIRVAVNLTGVVDTTTLASSINAAIQSAGNGSSQAAAAFKAAGIKAVINTDSTGKQQLAFTSSTTAFQAEAGDRLANALLGNYTSSSDPTGLSISATETGPGVTAAPSAAETVSIKISGPGFTSAQFVTLAIAATDAVSNVVSNLNTALAANTTLAAAGITASSAGAGSALIFTSTRGEGFSVAASGDANNFLGFGTALTGAASAVTYSTFTAGTAADATIASAGTLSILVEGAGGSGVTISATGAAALTAQNLADQLNTAIAGSTTLTQAALQVTVSVGQLVVTSNNSTKFQVASTTANAVLGFSTIAGSLAASTLAVPTELTFNPGGAQVTGNTTSGADPTPFTPLFYGNDVQNLVFTAKDASGTVHSLSVQLTNANALTLDQAVNTINTKLQQSNDSTLNKIVAAKERSSGTAEGIRFLSGSTTGFSVGIGNTYSSNGVSSSTSFGSLLTSFALSGLAGAADISSQANGQTAVSTLATAVSTLAAAQATVGKGQNRLQFAVGLAFTQVNNLLVAQGRIRDADLAAEAANLTRASISLQSGVAALAQANSAPQAVLALLRG